MVDEKEMDEIIRDEAIREYAGVDIKQGIMFRCTHCGKEHLSYKDLLKCCPGKPHSFEEIVIWHCPNCDAYYETPDGASNCCTEED